ncbi:hypothetical protein [Tengunoibacter tsumagoiensis]|uniref:Uncharacterized protein n=1 Tax=Tengunoibacter tsumagoiensis TaxID=2014871 RepID=A0A402A290_9CHLR|nr:hypothetical protein [Tengunoibacter tsumagoiensis]GCE13111.1 hypothetical protein KTT_29700 [Tengunoibacter tsumagoiensis]
MVRALSPTLQLALNQVTRHPALSVVVEDHVQHYTLYQNPGTADAWNDACLASDGNVVRVQVPRGGTGFAASFLVQRITDPSQSSQWSHWITLPGSSGLLFQDGGCAIANSGGMLFAFAQQGTGGNTLLTWTSSTNGTTWSGPTSVVSPPGGALLKGIASAGNADVFFLYDVAGGESIGCCFWTGSNWTPLITWTLPTLPFGQGLAATWNSFIYTLIYSDGYSLATCSYDPSLDLWQSGFVIAPSTNTAISRIAPRLSFVDGLYLLTCLEQDNGALTGTVYSYPRLRQSVDLIHWSNGLPLPALSAHYGAVAFSLASSVSGSAGPRYYVATLASVLSAPAFQANNPAQTLDLSGAVLSYRRTERAGRPGELEVVLDNTNGVYSHLVTTGSSPQPLGLATSLVLSTGCLIGVPVLQKVGTYRVQTLRFERTPVQNQIVLQAQDLTFQLDLLSRYQGSYLNQTVSFLIQEICARAGLFEILLPLTTQMAQIIPGFVIQAGLSYRHALDELCLTYGLVYFLDQDEILQFRELSSSDPLVWSYRSEIESVTFAQSIHAANHIIVTGKAPAGGLLGALTTAELVDTTSLQLLASEHLLSQIDVRLTDPLQCAAKASFLLAQEQRNSLALTVTIPLNPALQLFDCLSLLDQNLPIGSGQQANGRIIQIQEHYSVAQALAEMRLTLEGC